MRAILYVIAFVFLFLSITAAQNEAWSAGPEPLCKLSGILLRAGSDIPWQRPDLDSLQLRGAEDSVPPLFEQGGDWDGNDLHAFVQKQLAGHPDAVPLYVRTDGTRAIVVYINRNAIDWDRTKNCVPISTE